MRLYARPSPIFYQTPQQPARTRRVQNRWLENTSLAWGCCCEATLFSLLPFLRSHVGEKIIRGGSFNDVHASKWGGKHAGKLSAAFHATLWSWCLEANSEFHTERLQHICEQISTQYKYFRNSVVWFSNIYTHVKESEWWSYSTI